MFVIKAGSEFNGLDEARVGFYLIRDQFVNTYALSSRKDKALRFSHEVEAKKLVNMLGFKGLVIEKEVVNHD